MPALLPESIDALAKLTQPSYGFDTVAPSLLDQLKEAIFNGMDSGRGSAFGSKIPLATAAYDLYDIIESEAAALYVGAPRYQSRSGREEGIWGQFGAWDRVLEKQLPTSLTEDALNAFSVKKWRYSHASPIENITAWLATVQTDFQAQVANRIVTRWVSLITQILYPESRLEFLGPCPKCGARWFTEAESGIRSASVSLTFPDGIAHAECRSCVAGVWNGGYEVLQMKFESELRETAIDNDSQTV